MAENIHQMASASETLHYFASLFEERTFGKYHSLLARVLGALPALVLTQACRWQGIAGIGSWWSVSPQCWEQGLGITPAEQKKAFLILQDRKLLISESRGKSKKLYFKVKVARFSDFIFETQQIASQVPVKVDIENNPARAGVDDIPVPELPVAVAKPRETSATRRSKAAMNTGKSGEGGESTAPADAANSPAADGVDEQPRKKWRCLTIPEKDDVHPPTMGIFSKVPRAFLSDEVLEHPSIPGLMLTRDQRMFKVHLEYSGDDGVVERETAGQAYNRMAWKKPTPPTPSRTDKDFVKMNMSLFPEKKKK